MLRNDRYISAVNNTLYLKTRLKPGLKKEKSEFCRGRWLTLLPFNPPLPLTQPRGQLEVLELEGGQTWSRLLLLRKRGSHGNGGGVWDGAEGRRAGGDPRGALQFPAGATLQLEHVRGVVQESSPVAQVLVL